MEFQSAYSAPFRGSDIECVDPSLAQQHFKDEVDINFLLERFKVTGQMPQGLVLPQYGDFTGVSDYRTARDVIRKADDAFMDLPPDLRSRFRNDPQLFLEFCSDEKNLDELRSLGLAIPAKQDAGVQGAKPIDPAAAGSGSEGAGKA